jgi:hypothetical protein
LVNPPLNASPEALVVLTVSVDLVCVLGVLVLLVPHCLPLLLALLLVQLKVPEPFVVA